VIISYVGWSEAQSGLAARQASHRLLAERARRKALVDLVSHASGGTIVVMEKGTELARPGACRLEPRASSLSGTRSNRLSYNLMSSPGRC
jgi:hypothetical protein